MAMKWYVVHTYSGQENRAKASLEERIRSASLEEFFGDILVPRITSYNVCYTKLLRPSWR